MEVHILGFIILLVAFKINIHNSLIIHVFSSNCSICTFLPTRKTLMLQTPSLSGCVSDALQMVLVVLEQQPVRDLIKSQGVWKRTTCQLNCSGSTNAWKGQPKKPLHSRGAREKDGPLGPLAMLQSLMPSICLNGFLNPGPPFDSSPRQAVLRLLSMPVINPFISKRSDQCCLEWELPCWSNAAGKNRTSVWP